MGRARGSNAVMSAAFETVYGTPPSSGYLRTPFISSNLGAERGLIEDDQLGRGRTLGDPVYDVTVNDGDVVVPLDLVHIGHWLKLLFGVPTTSESGGLYLHNFASGKLALPARSIEIGHPDLPGYSTHYGVRANSLAIDMQRSGMTQATIGLIAKGETVLASTSSTGTVTAMGNIERFAAATGAIEIDGAQMGEIVMASMTFSNGMEKDETIRPDGEINDVDPGTPSSSIRLLAKFADQSLLQKATAGTPVALTLLWRGPRETAFQITFGRVFLPRPKRPIQGPAGIQVEFNAMAAGDPVIAVFLRNETASYA